MILDYKENKKIITKLGNIKIGDKVESKGYIGNKKYKGYIAVIDPNGGFLLRLKGYDGGNGYFWNKKWYPEHEKKEEENCIWTYRKSFTLIKNKKLPTNL